MASLAVATGAVLVHFGPPWLAATAVLAFGVTLWREWRRMQGWGLRWLPGHEGGWQRQLTRHGQWQPVEIRCDYLGPWVVGLRVSGRRFWLWPDSATFEQRRELRRILLWSKPTTNAQA